MQRPSLDFYFDLVCPYAYLASLQIEALAQDGGADLRLVPILLGGVFRAIGAPDHPGQSAPAAKQAYAAIDLARSAARWGVTLVPPEGHPRRTVLALRALLACGDVARGMRGLYAAYWSGHDLERPEEVARALDAAGLDGAAAVAAAGRDEIKAALRANTDAAVAEGVFGVPTVVVRAAGARELLWGVDRLDFARARLGLPRAEPAPAARARRPEAIEVFFDYASPYAYLALTQLRAFAQRTGVRCTLSPILLGALFRNIGTPNVPMFAMSDAKRAYQAEELARWARRWSVPFQFPTRFPMNSVKALRATLLVPEAQRLEAVERLSRAYWAEDRDIADEGVLAELLAPITPEPIVPRLAEAKDALFANTARAEKEGIFGVPTFRVGEALYWGQDRLEWIEDELATPTR